MARSQASGWGAACLWLLLACCNLQAQPAPSVTPYGHLLYRQDDPRSAWRPHQPVLPDVGDAPGVLEQRIDRLEARTGPFSPELLEPLRNLGAARFSAGDFRGAGAAWSRALHLIRVNEGLQSPAQRWLLEHLGEASLADGRIAQADEQQGHLYRLVRKQANAADPVMQQTAARYADWMRGAYLAGVDRERYPRLVALLAMYDDLLDAATRERGPTDRALLPYLRGRLDAVYLLTAYPGETRSQAAGPAETSPGEGKLDLIRFLELKRDAFREGERTAERIQAILAADLQASETERADALLALADWYQWHQRAAQSLPLYAQCWTLAGEGGAAWRSARFGAPLELPPDIVFQPGRLPLPERADTALRLRFGVSRQGRVQDARWLPDEDDTSEAAAAGQALALLAGLRFRPRLVAGQPVDTPDLERHYHTRH